MYISNLFDISGHARASTIRYTRPSRLKTGTSGGGEMKERGIWREKSFSRCKRGGRGIEKEWKGGERERQEERARRRERETNFLSIMSSNVV